MVKCFMFFFFRKRLMLSVEDSYNSHSLTWEPFPNTLKEQNQGCWYQQLLNFVMEDEEEEKKNDSITRPQTRYQSPVYQRKVCSEAINQLCLYFHLLPFSKLFPHLPFSS